MSTEVPALIESASGLALKVAAVFAVAYLGLKALGWAWAKF